MDGVTDATSAWGSFSFFGYSISLELLSLSCRAAAHKCSFYFIMSKLLNVLVVDDNPVERALLVGLLGKVAPWRIKATACDTGNHALTFMVKQIPDIAFIDFRLHNETGTDLIRKLRSSGCRAGLVLFTGITGEEALLEALRAGADDYLSKSHLSVDALSRVIHNTLTKVDTTRALDVALTALRESKEGLEERVRERTRELQEAQEKLKTITSTANDPIIMLDHHARITFWNPAAQQVFGYSEQEIMGRDIYELLPSSTFQMGIRNTFQNFQQTGAGAMMDRVSEFTVRRKDGKHFPVAASIARIKHPQGWHVVVIPRDITQKRQNEIALHKAKDEAEQATRLKDQFVSMVAHDLRGPFTTILGFLELMDKDVEHPLSEKQKSFLRWVVDSSQKMIRMIDEILNISRLKTGKILPQPRFLSARSLTSSIMANLAPLAEKKGIHLDNLIPKDMRIYADPDLFGEVIQNLLSNAIKFSMSGDKIVFFRPEGQPSTLAVKDHGVGIAEDQLLDIFKLDKKTSTTGTAGESGTGFGLPFSADLMKAHHGALIVESTPGKGSIFSAILPEVVPRILVVDDDLDSRSILEFYLQKEKVQVDTADSGYSGKLLLQQHTYHLIICDIQMPGMTGFEFLQIMRSDPKTKNIPAILVTSDQSIQTREKAFKIGAYDFLTKPIASQDFIPRIRRFLGL